MPETIMTTRGIQDLNRPVVMDAAAAAYDQVMINAGRRGLMVKLAPSDIVPPLAALVADVAV
jgi:prolyl-tRNA editing enzyme YbaK/EbsC (Cys-tRNA(Pro) deacylase)